MRAPVRLLVLLLALPVLPAAGEPAAVPVTVGTLGNEPLVLAAPDGTVYVTALQHLYVSTDGGRTFRLQTDLWDHLSLASDSSIAVDARGRLYYAAAWPYAGVTEVCVSDDRGARFQCNRGALPAVTDRMWVAAPSASRAFLVANEALYQPVLAVSADRGHTWLPSGASPTLLQSHSGPLVAPPGRDDLVVQPIKNGDLHFLRWSANGGLATLVRTPLPSPLALPSADFDGAGNLYTATEEPIVGGGARLLLGRSSALGAQMQRLVVPTPGVATVAFSWVAAGAEGHVGIVYYASATAGRPGAMPASAVWDVWWAESRDAHTATPTWTTRMLEADVHRGPVCIAAGCANRFAGDFISADIDARGQAHAVWMRGGGTPVVRYVQP